MAIDMSLITPRIQQLAREYGIPIDTLMTLFDDERNTPNPSEDTLATLYGPGDEDEDLEMDDDEEEDEEDEAFRMPGEEGGGYEDGDGTGAGGTTPTGETVAENMTVSPDNPWGGYIATEQNMTRAEAFEVRKRAEARQDARDAANEERIRSRPRTSRAGPAPIARIPKEALSPNNPYAGVDDTLARRWEQTHGPLQTRSSTGGNLADMIARLRASITGYQESAVPEKIGEPRPLSGRFTNPLPKGGTAQDAWRQAKGFADVDQQESTYYLPFFNEALGGPERAVSNALRSVGFDTTANNPYVSHLQRLGNKMSSQAMLSRLMKGEVPDERVIASDILSALSAGKTRIFTPETLRAELSAMRGNPDVNETQKEVITAFERDPEFAARQFETASNIPPEWKKYRQMAQDRAYDEFLNKAPQMKDKSILDFIMGSF